jgi:hypothetical protein
MGDGLLLLNLTETHGSDHSADRLGDASTPEWRCDVEFSEGDADGEDSRGPLERRCHAPDLARHPRLREDRRLRAADERSARADLRLGRADGGPQLERVGASYPRAAWPSLEPALDPHDPRLAGGDLRSRRAQRVGGLVFARRSLSRTRKVRHLMLSFACPVEVVDGPRARGFAPRGGLSNIHACRPVPFLWPSREAGTGERSAHPSRHPAGD